MDEITMASRVRGCLLGGAIGDALGAPVEFASGEQIAARFGSAGVREYAPTGYGSGNELGLVTDDTQMTLFTIEGIIRAILRMRERGLQFTTATIHQAYLRWADTQAQSAPVDTANGWLAQEAWLYSQRAPGLTCLGALAGGTHGSVELGTPARNDSKGCGGVMRSAPFGWLSDGTNHEWIYDIACEAAGYTHGHRTGQVASGAFAVLIAHLMDGNLLEQSVDSTIEVARGRDETGETVRALVAARELASSGRQPSRRAIESLGQAWIAEEALGLSVYAALSFPEPCSAVDALSLAVSHGGDSDSTGSICGNILGALWGEAWLPPGLAADVEGRDTMLLLADDFLATLADDGESAVP